MWQNLVVAVVVVIAAAYVIRQLVRSLTGRRTCDTDHCAACPFSDECGHKETEDQT